MENNKKILVPTIIAVVTLVLLVFGATYAYFTVGSTNNFGTKELNANIQDMADAVVLEQVNNTLSLNVTRAMMSQDNAGTYYYASGSSTPANIAKISEAGEGRYACDYKIKVTKSASSPENDLYTAYYENSTNEDVEIIFDLNNTEYDFMNYYDSDSDLFPITYEGTISSITKNTPQYITTNLAIRNAYVDQNYLKGKDITLTFEVTNFDCYLTEADDSAPIYAIYSEPICEYEEEGECYEYGPSTLAFYQNHDEVNVGDTYDGYTVTGVYKNLNNTNFSSMEDIPWIIPEDDNLTLVIEEPIKPKNTAWWFSCSNVYKLYNLDISEVTDMSYMFASASLYDRDSKNAISVFDTTKVINMEGMFTASMVGDILDISRWDTSNVTNMSRMFEGFVDGVVGDITRREITSNGKTYIAWDTSKVTNMSYMFSYAENTNLDLRSWQVPLVTEYENFNEEAYDIIPPNWVN